MQWEKIGKIFDPHDFNLADGCTSFAKSPQAVVRHDCVRIYFSSQKKTSDGKWVSCPQYADFTHDIKTILGVSQHPLIEQGKLGSFDEHGIFPFHVFTHHNRTLAYTSGWSRRVSVSVDMAIGLAESFDGGETFVRHGLGGPIMPATYLEPCMICDAFVRFYDGRYYMWYIFGSAWKNFTGQHEPDRIYKIAQATSPDGLNWKRTGRSIIPDVREDECQALPSVIRIGNRYHMIFCFRKAYDFRHNPENAYRLGYAYSDDLVNWVRDDSLVGIDRGAGGWDSDMQCYPNLFSCNGEIYLLYNGNEFGKNGFGLAKLLGVS